MRRRISPSPPGSVAGVPVRGLGVGLGLLRCAIGAVMIGDPPRLARLLGVDTVTAQRTGWLTMMIGGRDVALGVGSLLTLRRGGSGRFWYAAQALTDSGDALAVAVAVRSGRASRMIGTVVVASAVAGAAANVAAMRADDGTARQAG